MFKKIVLLFSCFLLMLPFGVLGALGDLKDSKDSLYPTEMITSDYKVEFLENSTSYQKIKFTNLKTNEVEYLEYRRGIDGEAIYTSTSKEGIVNIKRVDDSIQIVNETTGETGYIDLNETEVVEEYANVTSGGNWQYTHSGQGSTDLTSAVVSVVAGILAQILFQGLPLGGVTGTLVSIATALVSYNAPRVYWKSEYYWRPLNNLYDERLARTSYFRYHDYTGYVGMEEAIVKVRHYRPPVVN